MKYLKLFDSLDFKKIDTNILMDALCQLKDGTYDVSINFSGSKLRDYFNNIVSVELIVNGLKEENANKYLDHVYQIAHQMLNNYYDETGNEVYLILYPSALDNWDEEHLLEFHLAPISEITKHHQVFWLMRKKDLYPNEVNPSYKSLSESIRMKYLIKFNEQVLNNESSVILFTQEEFDDIMDVFQDIVDEYNLRNFGDEYVSMNALSQLPETYIVKIVNTAENYMTDITKGRYIDIIIYTHDEEMRQDIDKLILRYNQMGYNAKIDFFFKFHGLNKISIEIRK